MFKQRLIASIVGAVQAPILVLWTMGFLGVLRVAEDYVIYPRLIRRGIELHPLAVIVAVLAGAELGGVAGMFLAVPFVAIATVVYRHWMEWRSEDVVDPTICDAERATPWRRSRSVWSEGLQHQPVAIPGGSEAYGDGACGGEFKRKLSLIMSQRAERLCHSQQ